MYYNDLTVKKLRKTNENGLKILSFNDKDKIKGKVISTRIDFLVTGCFSLKFPKNYACKIRPRPDGLARSSLRSSFIWPYFKRKTNKKGLKTLSFNDKDKIKGKVNSTRIDFLV
ncbi:hypothetical protein DVH24_007734 [Malus domestica]|uniref:Uncharacterized protein n=1 Tax=Malus domestica TaxID=3750 RepID=A0A498JNR2_MALDO|nr:hypothetical protein DVH24_007734 [Malus domestica]